MQSRFNGAATTSQEGMNPKSQRSPSTLTIRKTPSTLTIRKTPLTLANSLSEHSTLLTALKDHDSLATESGKSVLKRFEQANAHAIANSKVEAGTNDGTNRDSFYYLRDSVLTEITEILAQSNLEDEMTTEHSTDRQSAIDCQSAMLQYARSSLQAAKDELSIMHRELSDHIRSEDKRAMEVHHTLVCATMTSNEATSCSNFLSSNGSNGSDGSDSSDDSDDLRATLTLLQSVGLSPTCTVSNLIALTMSKSPETALSSIDPGLLTRFGNACEDVVAGPTQGVESFLAEVLRWYFCLVCGTCTLYRVTLFLF